MNTKQAQAKAKARKAFEMKMAKEMHQDAEQIAQALANENIHTINIGFAKTHLIKVIENTVDKFKAILKDPDGVYEANLTKNSQGKIVVDLYGAPVQTLDKGFAYWNYDMIWHDLEKQGVSVNCLK